MGHTEDMSNTATTPASRFHYLVMVPDSGRFYRFDGPHANPAKNLETAREVAPIAEKNGWTWRGGYWGSRKTWPVGIWK